MKYCEGCYEDFKFALELQQRGYAIATTAGEDLFHTTSKYGTHIRTRMVNQKGEVEVE